MFAGRVPELREPWSTIVEIAERYFKHQVPEVRIGKNANGVNFERDNIDSDE